MGEQTIEMEANTIEEARKRLYADNVIVIQETILRLERTDTIEVVADTVSDADVKIRNSLPVGSKIERREVKVEPKRAVLRIKAIDEEAATREAVTNSHQTIETVILHKKGRKGFLGIGRRLNIYEVVVNQKAVLSVRFHETAHIRAKIRYYSAEELLQIVGELRQKDLQRNDIIQRLNPKRASDIARNLEELDKLNPPFGLDAIEDSCRKQPGNSWAKAIQDAHAQALIARTREIRRLRALDVDIAEIFSFYISIDWNDNSYQEPTGIPRLEYDAHGTIDSRGRQRIPHYSTDETVFVRMAKWVKDALGEDFYNLYLHILTDENHNARTTTLEQKCNAIIKARKLQLKGGRERASGTD